MDDLIVPEEKEKLLKTLSRFDGSITVEEEVTGTLTKKDQRSYHTVFLHILLESLCQCVEPHDMKRGILFNEVCKRLATLQYLNDSFVLDGFESLRKELAGQFFNFIKEIHSKAVPDPTETLITADVVLNDNFPGVVQPPNKYDQNFEELEEIAKGGFGIVCKAKHKVTEIEYAIKKIIFKYKNDAKYMKIVREAKNIATLNHPNIVSYNNAWIECLTPDVLEDESDSSDSKESSNECLVTDTSLTFSKISKSDESENSFSESENFIVFSKTEDNSHLSSSVLCPNDDIGCDENNSFAPVHECSVEKEYKFNLNSLNLKVMLCIQMEFCDCDLRLWLDRRAKGEELPFQLDIMKIFKDILSGVSYIHSRSIIHRDLKPQNIFYSKTNNVLKIGDFGLATLEKCAAEKSYGCASNTYTGDLGTIPYAAPEQINRKSYDSKVDIYSIGVILIELLNNFSTRMEFFKTIDEILKGKFPEEMVNTYPKLIDLVKELLKDDPSERPSATDILDHIRELDDEVEEIAKLKAALSLKDQEIERLRTLVLSQENFILNQKQKLIQLQNEL